MPATHVWPRQVPLQFDSALSPLLDDLYQDVAQHDEVMQRVQELQTKWQLPDQWPDSESRVRLDTASAAFDTVLTHVLGVEELCGHDHVLLPRERFSEARWPPPQSLQGLTHSYGCGKPLRGPCPWQVLICMPSYVAGELSSHTANCSFPGQAVTPHSGE